MAGRFVFQSMSRSRSLPASEAGIGTQVTRHFNTFPGSRPAAKTICRATGMPSIISKRLKLFSTEAGRATFEEMSAKDDKFWGQIMWLCGFSCVSCTFGLFLEERTSSSNNRGPRPCASCNSCQHRVQ